MKLQLKRGVSAQEMAEIHHRLGEARLDVLAVVSAGRIGSSPLKATSQDALARTAHSLLDAMFSMESAFMSATGDELAPFANPSNPRAWLDWLEGRHLSLVES